MSNKNLAELEKSDNFKKKYLPPFFWLKSKAIYLPSLFLFFALVGMIYLLNVDMLLSIYVIPFVLLFLIATIWLKAMKKHVLKQLFEKDDSYLVCLSKVVKEEANWIYVIFTTSNKRHNKVFIENTAKELEKNDFSNSISLDNKNKIAESVNESYLKAGDDIYIKAFRNRDVIERQSGWMTSKILPLLYFGSDNIVLIKHKDVNIS